jgi:hypothetical protein
MLFYYYQKPCGCYSYYKNNKELTCKKLIKLMHDSLRLIYYTFK